MDISNLKEELTAHIQAAYTEGVTMEEAEKLAAKFLHAQIMLGEALRSADLDARMRKSGLKAVKAAVYLDEAKKGERKPTEAALSALVDSNSLVTSEQTGFDQAEVDRNELDNLLNVARDGHIFFRGVAKGRFE